MNEFWIWFSVGAQHILDFQGYDHILFVTLLTLTFPFQEWKKLLVLITAFTVGHSVSLALSATNIVSVPQQIIEFLIALTILSSAIYNLTNYKKQIQHTLPLYFITLCFGLIHGLGFSYLLKAMLGKEQSVLLPLMYFNIGLELGQVIIVLIVLVFSLFLGFFLKWQFKTYKLIVTCLITFVALKISAERLLELFQ